MIFRSNNFRQKFQFSINVKVSKEIGKYEPFKGKTKNIVLEKDLMEDLRYEDFKATTRRMLKELNEDVQKVKKVIYFKSKYQ